MLSSNAKLALEVQIGDSVTINTPAGNADFIVAGFGSDDREWYQGQTYLVAVYMTRTAFAPLMEQNGISFNPTCYVQFQNASKASGAITEIKEQYGLPEGSISENTAIMGIAGKSSNESMKNIYGLAAILFILVLLAGVLMISGSMNSNVAGRTKFFGMMRCIGASRRQIIRYVRLEALNWCKTAVPVGLFSGTAISCGVCAMLHYGIGGEFQTMPVLALSPVGLISGALVGIVTVLLAAQSPAKRAAKVSPIAAASGSSETAPSIRHTMRLNSGKIEKALGVHHATASKKNWFLMTASFSLSIILFLCFTVGLDFAHGLVPSLRSWQPDITLTGYANEPVLSRGLSDTIRSVPGVDHVFGSAYIEHVSAASSRQGIDHVNITSYSDYLLDSVKGSLVQGDLSEIVKQISGLAERNVIFADQRENNRTDANTYLATKFVMYSFLAIIAMITLFHIINSISMSVTARMKQYGAMRAVGMDEKQLTRYFGTPWSLPIDLLAIILVFSIVTAIAAVHAPAKRIRNMAITATINEL